MKLIIVLVLCYAVGVFCQDEFECTEEARDRMDTYVSRIMVVGEPDRFFPINQIEMRRFCNEGIRYLVFIEKYVRRCLNEFAKKTALVLLYPIKNQVKLLCKPGRIPKKAVELLRAAPCANAAKDNLQNCNIQWIDSFEAIANQAPDHLKIPLACCNFNKNRECVRSESEEFPVCTPHTRDFVERYFDDVLGGIINLLCANYEEGSDRCEQIIGLTPENLNKENRPKSVILPAIDIISNIKDDSQL